MKVMYKLHALGVTAGRTMMTALGVHQHITALRALAGKVLGQAIVFKDRRVLGLLNVGFQHAGDSIGARKNALTMVPGHARTANAAKVLDHLGYLHSGAEGEGYKPPDRF